VFDLRAPAAVVDHEHLGEALLAAERLGQRTSADQLNAAMTTELDTLLPYVARAK
jgi:hypothetical protein